MLIDSLWEQWARAQDTYREMAVVEQHLATPPPGQKDADIPGVGLTATATVAAISDVHTFNSGREFVFADRKQCLKNS
jgi:transposase